MIDNDIKEFLIDNQGAIKNKDYVSLFVSFIDDPRFSISQKTQASSLKQLTSILDNADINWKGIPNQARDYIDLRNFFLKALVDDPFRISEDIIFLHSNDHLAEVGLMSSRSVNVIFNKNNTFEFYIDSTVTKFNSLDELLNRLSDYYKFDNAVKEMRKLA